MPWQKSQGTLHALNEINGRHFEDLAEGTGSREYPCAIPQRSWRAAQFRRRKIPARQIRRHRQATLPVVEAKARHATLFEAQFSHGIAAGRCRYLSDRALAGA